MNRHKCDILNLEWVTNSRDTNIVEPVLSYLELAYDVQIVRSSYENYLWKIIYYKPRMLVLSNYNGDRWNFIATKQAYAMGIKTIALISEGNVIDAETAPEFFWGWNKERVNCLDALLVWTERSRRLFLDNIKEAKEMNIKVSGATGFDRYQFLEFTDKESFLKKYRRNEKKIIGIASWGFEGINMAGDTPTGKSRYTKKELRYLLDTRDRLNHMYGRFIMEHPDTLFILKFHPASVGLEEKTEFKGLGQHQNVIEVVMSEEIADVINVCDFWMSFESTTAIEAWLLKKQTLFINPTGGYFKRANVVDGSPEIINYEELEHQYSSFYSQGIIDGFQEKELVREKILEDTIQYSDGKNHIRAANSIMEIYRMEMHRNQECTPKQSRIRKEKIRELLAEVKRSLLSHTFLRFFIGYAMRYWETTQRYVAANRSKEVERYKKAIRCFDNLLNDSMK